MGSLCAFSLWRPICRFSFCRSNNLMIGGVNMFDRPCHDIIEDHVDGGWLAKTGSLVPLSRASFITCFHLANLLSWCCGHGCWISCWSECSPGHPADDLPDRLCLVWECPTAVPSEGVGRPEGCGFHPAAWQDCDRALLRYERGGDWEVRTALTRITLELLALNTIINIIN